MSVLFDAWCRETAFCCKWNWHPTCKGNAGKDEMVASVRDRDRGHTLADDDEADAIALLHLARKMATDGV
jgi:hypothetical protein